MYQKSTKYLISTKYMYATNVPKISESVSKENPKYTKKNDEQETITPEQSC